MVFYIAKICILEHSMHVYINDCRAILLQIFCICLKTKKHENYAQANIICAHKFG